MNDRDFNAWKAEIELTAPEQYTQVQESIEDIEPAFRAVLMGVGRGFTVTRAVHTPDIIRTKLLKEQPQSKRRGQLLKLIGLRRHQAVVSRGNPWWK